MMSQLPKFLPKIFRSVVQNCCLLLALTWQLTAVAAPDGESSMPPAGMFEQRFIDIGGKPATLNRWQGKVLILNFWATWCPPCRQEIPSFNKLQQRFGSRQVQVVGISMETPEKVAQFARSAGINYPLLTGGNDALRLSKELGNARLGLPYTVIINPLGQVVFRKVGLLIEAEMLEMLKAAGVRM